MYDYPLGLESPVLYLSAVFFLMLGTLLALEWAWRIAWSFFESRQPFRSPATAVRVILLVLLVGGLVRIIPRLWVFMRWPALSFNERVDLLTLSAQSEIAAVCLFTVAWFLGMLGEPMVKYQLAKEPLPLDLWPTREQITRPLKIGFGVFGVAFALTYLR